MKDEIKIEEIIKSASNKNEIIELLTHLFITKKASDNAISHKNYFDRYFSLSLLPNELTQQEFDDAFNSVSHLSKNLILLNEKNSSALTSKLYHKYINSIISDVAEFKDSIELIFEVFESIEAQFSEEQIENIGTTNLRLLITQIYKNSTIEKQEKRKILIELLQEDRKDYRRISGFLNYDTITLFSNDFAERKMLFDSFKDIQWRYQQRAIDRDSLLEVIEIMQQTHRLLRQSYLEESEVKEINWFKKYIIEEKKEYLKRNLKDILEYVKKSPQSNNKDFSRHFIDSIFHDIFTLKVFNDPQINEDVEDIVDYYDGLLLTDESFLFSQQKPVFEDLTDFNDHVYPNNDDPKIFDLNVTNYIKVIVNPLNTKYWRLGFRLSKNEIIPPIRTTRHDTTHLDTKDSRYVNIAKGQPVSGTKGPWDKENMLLFDNYFEAKSLPVTENYENEKVIICLISFGRFLRIIIRSHKFLKIFSVQGKNEEYNYCTLTAWSDSQKFNLKAKIKTGSIISLAQFNVIEDRENEYFSVNPVVS